MAPSVCNRSRSSIGIGLKAVRDTLQIAGQMSAQKNYWMVKSEPAAYAWQQFVIDGHTAWTGVRNFQARNNLRAMRKGDLVLFYHSVTDKEVVGVARVKATAYPDPTAKEGSWDCVDLEPVKAFKHPVSLDWIKSQPSLADIGLLRQSRLSVIPLSPAHYETILEAGTKSSKPLAP